MLAYTVVRGDTLAAIARRHGLNSWQELYHHPENAAFRAKRPNPNVIHPGDVLMVPGPGESAGFTTAALAGAAPGSGAVPKTAGKVNIHKEVLPYLDIAYCRDLVRPALTDDQLRILGAWSSSETEHGLKLFNNNFMNVKQPDATKPHFIIATKERVSPARAALVVSSGEGTIVSTDPDGMVWVLITKGKDTQFASFATPDEGASFVVKLLFQVKDGDGKITEQLLKTNPHGFGFLVGPRWASASATQYAEGVRDHFAFRFRGIPITRGVPAFPTIKLYPFL